MAIRRSGPPAFPTPRWNVVWPALRAAKAREAEDAVRRAEEDRVREEDRARRREEIETKEREDRERAEALRLKAEEEERAAKAEAAAKVAAAEARAADVLGTRARSTTPGRPQQPPNRPTVQHPAAPASTTEDARGPASAKPGLSPRKTDREKDDRSRPWCQAHRRRRRPPRRQADAERRTCG